MYVCVGRGYVYCGDIVSYNADMMCVCVHAYVCLFMYGRVCTYVFIYVCMVV